MRLLRYLSSQLDCSAFRRIRGEARSILATGKFGHGFPDTAPALADWQIRYKALFSADYERGLDRAVGMIAKAALISRNRVYAWEVLRKSEIRGVKVSEDFPGLSEAFEGGTASELRDILDVHRDRIRMILGDIDAPKDVWVNNYLGASGCPRPLPDDKLLAKSREVDADPEWSAMWEEYQEIADTVLRYAEHRRLITPERREQWQREFSLDGQIAFVPLVQVTTVSRPKQLLSAVGLHAISETEEKTWSEMMSPSIGYVKNPVGPHIAMRLFVHNIVDAADENPSIAYNEFQEFVTRLAKNLCKTGRYGYYCSWVFAAYALFQYFRVLTLGWRAGENIPLGLLFVILLAAAFCGIAGKMLRHFFGPVKPKDWYKQWEELEANVFHGQFELYPPSGPWSRAQMLANDKFSHKFNTPSEIVSWVVFLAAATVSYLLVPNILKAVVTFVN